VELPSVYLTNRALALIALWITAILGYHWKKQEAALARSHAELDRRVHERTADLEREMLAHKAARVELARSESRFRGLVESSPDWIWEIDRGGIYTYASPRVREILGCRPDEIVGKTPFDLMPPEEAARLRPVFESFARARQPFYALENRNRTKDGRIVTLETSGVPLFSETGEFLGYCGIGRDVTQRKAREHELLRLSEAVRYSPVGITITDERGTIEYANPKFTEITGYSLDEAKGQNPRILKSGETPSETYRNLWGTVTSGRAWRGIVRDKTKSGQTFTAALTIAPVVGAEERITNYIGIMEDVTERHNTERQLHQAQKMEAVGQLTGGLAHDFNNLLLVVLGNLEMLEDHIKDNPEARRFVRTSLEAVERAAQLTQRLLAFARKQPLQPTPTDVTQVMQGMHALLERTLGEHIQIETVSAAGLWLAMVDPAQLENAVLNLAINARDAMPGGGKLTIEAANVRLDDAYAEANPFVTPGQYVLVAVSDTGTGIPPEIVDRVFEPFFTTKETGKGTGLGLSMVYGFVKQSGGHIKIYSEPGLGTTVKMYLPRAHAGPPERATKLPGAVTTDTGTETILVVEDDPLVRAYVEAQIKSLGYAVISAADGRAALQRLDEHPEIALLFTDVVMPGMSGGQLAAEALQRRPGLKVLFTSGYTENAILHHGKLDPGVHLLNKPYRREELAKKIRRVLDAPPRQ
jgi:PAS domain S-box-containing protein